MEKKSIAAIFDNNLFKRYVPGHVTGARDDLVVIVKSAAGQVAGVTWQLPAHPHITFPSFKAIDGTNIVQPTARYITTRGCVCTSHYPRRP